MTYRVGGGLKNEELKNFFKKLELRQKGHPQVSCARGLAYTKRHSQIFKNKPFNVKVVGSLMTTPAFRALYLTSLIFPEGQTPFGHPEIVFHCQEAVSFGQLKPQVGK